MEWRPDQEVEQLWAALESHPSSDIRWESKRSFRGLLVGVAWLIGAGIVVAVTGYLAFWVWNHEVNAPPSLSAASCVHAWDAARTSNALTGTAYLATADPRPNDPASSVEVWVGVTDDLLNGDRPQCSVKFVFPGGRVAESDGTWVNGAIQGWSEYDGPYPYPKASERPTPPLEVNASVNSSGELSFEHQNRQVYRARPTPDDCC